MGKICCAVIAVSACCLVLPGCGSSNGGGGGGTNQPPPTNPSFSLSVNPASVTLSQGASGQTVQMSVEPAGGFTGAVTVTAPVLPEGVTANPSTLSVSVGTTAAMTFSASTTAPAIQESISFNGTAGTLSATASLGITVKAQPVSDPYVGLGGEIARGFFDESRKLLFVTNIGLNELDVISGTDGSVQARVPVPVPMGIDQMADGKTLVIGTEAQELVTVDEDTYAVTRHPFPGSCLSTCFYPTVAAMANGKVFAIGLEQGLESDDIVDGGQHLFAWDSNANTFSMVEPTSASTGWETDHLSRSADHKWMTFSADYLYVYSSDQNNFTTSSFTTPLGGVRGYAMNSDGSKIAVAYANQVTFMDRSFQILGQSSIPYAFPNVRTAVRFSTDDSKLYLQYPYPLALEEVDPVNYVALGYLSAQMKTDDNIESLLAVDGEGHGYFGDGRGVRVVNLANAPIPNPSGTALSGPVCPSLVSSLPLNTAQQVEYLGQLTGITMYVGGQPASIGNGGSEITIPASGSAGLEDVECIDGQGSESVSPADVSYGAAPLAFGANLLPPGGNVVSYVFGYGLSSGQSQAPAVTVGGNTSPQTKMLESYQAALQSAALIVPSGSPGATVDVGISSSIGNGTLSAAAAYYPTPTILPASGIIQLLFDTHRDVLYALKGNKIDVLDASTLKWKTPISLALPGADTFVQSMEITPDGSRLLVLGSLAGTKQQMLVVDPDGNAAPTVATYSYSGTVYGSFGITNRNTAILAGVPALLFDLSTNSFHPLSFPSGQVVRASSDGTHVYSAALDDSGGTVYSIDPATLNMTSEGFAYLFWADLAVSPDGSAFSPVLTEADANGDVIGFFNSNLEYVNTNAYPDFSPPDDFGVLGAAYSPGGKVVAVPLGDSIELWDALTGRLRARLLTPEDLQTPASSQSAVARTFSINSSGDTMYAVSVSGLSVIKLPESMDKMAPMEWPALRTALSDPALHGTMTSRVRVMVGHNREKNVQILP